jgi:hypothetical protein
MRPTGNASLTLILRFGWAVCLVVVCTGALLLPATIRTPGYFTALEAHRAAGWVLAVAAPVALLVHLVATGSRLRGVVGVGALVGVAYLAAGLIPHALDFPDAIGFVDLQRRLLFDALHNGDLDAGPLRGAVALAAVLTLGGLLVAVGIVSRVRERATSRWSGAALTLLGCWALFGGAVLHLQPRETVFGTLTLHSVAGAGTLALLVLHLAARRAARADLPRAIVALVGAVWMLGAAVAWWASYDYEHFRGFRPETVGDVFSLHRTTELPDPAGNLPPPPAPLDAVQPAVSCGASNCHEQNTREWAGSLHRFSASNAFYRAAVGEAIQMGGMEAASFCASCHDPERVLTGTVAQAYAEGVPEGGSDGVSCTVCHGIVEVDHGPDGPIGNGRMTVALDPPYPGARLRRERSVRLDPRHHRQGFVTNERTLATTVTCVGCHRLELPAPGANEAFVVQHADLFDGFTGFETAGCTGCHLPQDDESIYIHRMAGIAVDLKHFATGVDAGDLALIEENAEAIRDLTGLLEYGPIERPNWPERPRQRWSPEGRLRPAKGGFLRLSAVTTVVDDSLDIALRTSNVSVGHPFPSGPFDLNQVWLEVRVADATGRVLHHVGGLDDRAAIVGTPVRLGAVEIGLDGPLKKHRILELQAVRDKDVLGQTPRVDHLSIDLPDDVVGPLEVRARWLYRRVRPEFAEWALEVSSSPIPPHEVASTWVTVP